MNNRSVWVEGIHSPRNEPDFASTLGFELTDWRDGYCALQARIRPSMLNRSGVLHGGILMTLLDICCARASCWAPADQPPRFAATLSLSTNFVAPGRNGIVQAIGRRVGGGTRIMTCRGEVLDEEGNVLASGTGTFRLRRVSSPAEKLDRQNTDFGNASC